MRNHEEINYVALHCRTIVLDDFVEQVWWRIEQLAANFSIDLLCFSLPSNHYYLILKSLLDG